MNFVYPTFAIVGLAALLIPIIIHLFNFRRFKKVYFTNVRFLKEVKQQSASSNRLKHLLILLSRMLALAFLVWAFAQPYIPKGETEDARNKGAKTISIFVDNSFSMNALSADVSLFEKAKQKAVEIVQAYSVNPENKFQLLTNDFQGKHQRILDKEEFLNYLEEVDITPNTRKFVDVIERQKQALEYADTEYKNLFLVSDFQKNVAKIDTAALADTTLSLYLVPLQSVEQQNLFIDSVWFASPIRLLNKPNKLLVRIQNTGDSDVSKSRLALRINGQTKALAEFSIPSKKTKIDTLNFAITQSGWHNAELAIEDAPINFDDTYYFTFEMAEKINVLSLYDDKTSPYLSALFQDETNFAFLSQSINKLDYAEVPKKQLIILNQLNKISSGLASKLQEYVKEGGSLLVFPDDNMDQTSYNNMLKAMKANVYQGRNPNQRQIQKVNMKQEIFRDVFRKLPNNTDLPYVINGFDMSNFSKARQEKILKFSGGSSCLSKYSFGKGKLYVAAFSLNTNNTNVPSHALFVPMVYKIGLVSLQSNRLAYTIGRNERIEINNKTDKKEAAFKLKGDAEELIPSQKILGSKLLLSINNQLKDAGIYKLYMDINKPLSYFGFNFNRLESVLEYFDIDQLKETYTHPNINFLEGNQKDLSIEVGQMDRGVALWKICLLLALLFLLIETLLLRFWR